MESKIFGIKRIEARHNLETIPIWDLNRECKLWGYRVELWKYGHKRVIRSDYRDRNRVILHKE